MDFKDFDISKFGSGDFIYADPPYLITKGSYNDGKRGFKGWCKDDDIALFQLLDKANAKGIKFALSNVIEHKGLMNEELKKWSEKYKVHYLNYNYKNCNYHGKNTEKKTIEVLITNY
jgi:site-specific DNA-adenine methylase